MQKTRLPKKLRFVLVGCLNTAIDFGVYVVAIQFGSPVLLANYLSTSVALCVSFIANKQFTFKDNSKTKLSQIGRFLAVTLFGLWVLQPIVIQTVIVLGAALNIPNTSLYIIGKILATAVTLVWNYILYNKLVFTDKTSAQK